MLLCTVPLHKEHALLSRLLLFSQRRSARQYRVAEDSVWTKEVGRSRKCELVGGERRHKGHRGFSAARLSEEVRGTATTRAAAVTQNSTSSKACWPPLIPSPNARVMVASIGAVINKRTDLRSGRAHSRRDTRGANNVEVSHFPASPRVQSEDPISVTAPSRNDRLRRARSTPIAHPDRHAGPRPRSDAARAAARVLSYR